MTRRGTALIALVLLILLAGCTTILGPDPADPEALSTEATYTYDSDTDAFIVIDREQYTAVYNVSARVTGDETSMTFHRTDMLTIERPLELEALQFRYPNGTMVKYIDGNPTKVYEDGSTEQVDTFEVDTTRQRTIVELPADEGQIAFTTPKTGKQIMVHTPVHGSYQVALPPNTDAAIPLLSQVQPSNDDRSAEGDRVHLHWDEITTDVLVIRWYLDRDLWLFGGLAGGLTILGIGGVIYYYRQIQRAQERREQYGFDVDQDDDRDPPPPGMR